MIPAIIVVSIILAIVIGLLVRARPRVVSVVDGSEDESGTKYRCAVCESQRVRVTDYHERCLDCGFSTEQTYDRVLRERINLLRDINSAISNFECADFQLGGSDPNWQTYASELSNGVALIHGGALLSSALLALDETELADQLRQMLTEEGKYASRAERYLKRLRPAKEVLSKDIQRRLRASERNQGDTDIQS